MARTLASTASACVRAIDGAIQRKMCGKETTLVFWNEDINNITTVIKLLKNSGILIDRVGETVKHEIQQQKDGFLGMLFGTLHASVLGNMLTRKGVIRAGTRYNHMNHIDKKLFSSTPSFKQYQDY